MKTRNTTSLIVIMAILLSLALSSTAFAHYYSPNNNGCGSGEGEMKNRTWKIKYDGMIFNAKLDTRKLGSGPFPAWEYILKLYSDTNGYLGFLSLEDVGCDRYEYSRGDIEYRYTFHIQDSNLDIALFGVTPTFMQWEAI